MLLTCRAAERRPASQPSIHPGRLQGCRTQHQAPSPPEGGFESSGPLSMASQLAGTEGLVGLWAERGTRGRGRPASTTTQYLWAYAIAYGVPCSYSSVGSERGTQCQSDAVFCGPGPWQKQSSSDTGHGTFPSRGGIWKGKHLLRYLGNCARYPLRHELTLRWYGAARPAVFGACLGSFHDRLWPRLFSPNFIDLANWPHAEPPVMRGDCVQT